MQYGEHSDTRYTSSADNRCGRGRGTLSGRNPSRQLPPDQTDCVVQDDADKFDPRGY